ncbi:hypothetical protein OH77DRAFT_1423711 [Trametes cingulata]|nr:hypothetical protein OH77DRAFT_1423711 [Trametes cingulata]
MAGVSFKIPLNVRDTIPEQFSNQLRLCPVETHGWNQHVLFAPDGLFPHCSRTVVFEDGAGNIEEWVAVDPVDETVRPRGIVPRLGSYCRLVFQDRRRFVGRISRVVEYQETRIVLWVEHTYSPASITLAVPYPFYEGTQWWYIRLRRLLGYLQPDNDHHDGVIGRSPNVDWWELDDCIQGNFRYWHMDN